MIADTIRLAGATRRYMTHADQPVTALDAVDLTVRPGEFVAIQGPSGSGKTTLLGLLAGIERADAGEVFVLGHDLGRLRPDELARLRRSKMGLVFQSFGLVAALTAGENVALPIALDGVPAEERAARAQARLADVGLGGAAHARIDELSGGERQRVGVARALVSDPELVLADEPTGSLDESNATAILDLLQELATRLGSALVLVTHDPASAARAGRRYALRDGRLAAMETH